MRRSRAVRRAIAVARLQRHRLRKILRDDVFVLVLAAACVGAASGVIAAWMVSASEAFHGFVWSRTRRATEFHGSTAEREDFGCSHRWRPGRRSDVHVAAKTAAFDR